MAFTFNRIFYITTSVSDYLQTLALDIMQAWHMIKKAPANVGSVVEWLKHRTDDQHGLGSKPACAILLCSWERHFTALSPAWWS